jgi:hypothetical protein
MYGEYAQKYRGYKVDELVTEGLTNLTPGEYVTPSSVYTLSGGTDSTKWTGAGLYCSDSMGMFFTFISERSDILVRVTLEGRVTEYTYDDFTLSGGRYEIIYTGIMAYEFDDTVTAELIDTSSGTVISTLTYSVGTYIAACESSTDTALVNLLYSIRCYGASAFEYMN